MKYQALKDKIKKEKEREIRRSVIISGGMIEREYVTHFLKEMSYTYLISADAGLKFLHEEQIVPTHIVGDFDSLEQGILECYVENPNVTIRMFNPVKDMTDTEIAIRLALELHSSEIWILGGTGGRIDHTFGNIQSLMIPLCQGIPAVIADSQNEIRLVTGDVYLTRERVDGRYLSLLPFGGPAEDLTVRGVKYPLEHFCMEPHNSLGVSNEVTDEVAEIHVGKGQILMILSHDASQI